MTPLDAGLASALGATALSALASVGVARVNDWRAHGRDDAAVRRRISAATAAILELLRAALRNQDVDPDEWGRQRDVLQALLNSTEAARALGQWYEDFADTINRSHHSIAEHRANIEALRLARGSGSTDVDLAYLRAKVLSTIANAGVRICVVMQNASSARAHEYYDLFNEAEGLAIDVLLPGPPARAAA